jgi:hypothetical protein
MSASYITVPGYAYPIEAKFAPHLIDTSTGEPIVRVDGGFYVWGRGCTRHRAFVGLRTDVHRHRRRPCGSRCAFLVVFRHSRHHPRRRCHPGPGRRACARGPWAPQDGRRGGFAAVSTRWSADAPVAARSSRPKLRASSCEVLLPRASRHAFAARRGQHRSSRARFAATAPHRVFSRRKERAKRLRAAARVPPAAELSRGDGSLTRRTCYPVALACSAEAPGTGQSRG